MGAEDGNIDYEEIRKQRLEENKRRMQELGLSELSKSLAKSVPKTNDKGTKPRVPKDDFPIEVRRSSRVSNGPQPNYCEAAFDFRLPKRSYPRIAGLPRKYASDKERIRAAESATKFQEELGNGHPSFVKPMLVSHVSGGFWLGLPLHFCKRNLPDKDGIIVLEDEKGDEWDSIYLAHRTGLSGGWRGFSMDHNLEDGDAIVFELIKPQRFKVHIIRASELLGKDAGEDDIKENVVKVEGGQKRKGGPETKKGGEKKRPHVKNRNGSKGGKHLAKVPVKTES